VEKANGKSLSNLLLILLWEGLNSFINYVAYSCRPIQLIYIYIYIYIYILCVCVCVRVITGERRWEIALCRLVEISTHVAEWADTVRSVGRSVYFVHHQHVRRGRLHTNWMDGGQSHSHSPYILMDTDPYVYITRVKRGHPGLISTGSSTAVCMGAAVVHVHCRGHWHV